MTLHLPIGSMALSRQRDTWDRALSLCLFNDTASAAAIQLIYVDHESVKPENSGLTTLFPQIHQTRGTCFYTLSSARLTNSHSPDDMADLATQ